MSLGWITLAVGVIGLGAVMGGLVISRRASRSLIQDRLGITEEAAREERVPLRRTPIGDALNRMLAKRGVGSDLATQLARADMKITVGEFIATTVILVVLAAGVSYFLLKGNVIIAAVATVGGFFAPRIYVGIVQRRRLKAFNDQLGDTINLMVNSLRAGYSILQAMEAVAEEMGEPISVEFGRVVQEVQLGIALEEGLDHMLRRVPSDDLDMMITAIDVQREVGGNLAEVLDSISYTIRERIRIKGEIRSLTGQSRISGYMVAMVPPFLAVFIYLINPDFMSLLFTDACGWILLAIAVIGLIVGFVVIHKIMQIDV